MNGLNSIRNINATAAAAKEEGRYQVQGRGTGWAVFDSLTGGWGSTNHASYAEAQAEADGYDS